METFETIEVDRRGPLAWVTLNRPDQANTLTVAMMRELNEAFSDLAADFSVRVVLITGAGDRHFCAGADLREGFKMMTGEEQGLPVRDDPIGHIEDIPKPVIAVLNGAAVGGGCEMALACDFRFMAHEALIGLPEVRFGAIPGAGGTQRLPRLVGLAKAKELLFTGRTLSAEEALSAGLVTGISAAIGLRETAERFAAALVEHADYALAALKLLTNTAHDLDLAGGLRMERTIAVTMGTPDKRMAALQKAAGSSPVYRSLFSGLQPVGADTEAPRG